MCGILLSLNLDIGNIDKIIRKLSLRGRDGYGYYLYRKDGLSISKKSIENVENCDITHFTEPIICIANSRAIPTTEYEIGAGLDVTNQQPFSDDKKRFIVVHNGIISNDKELKMKYDLNPSSKVDSAILPLLFEKLGVVESLQELKGSFAILCFDTKLKKIYAAKNFMPLGVAQIGSGLVFASMEEMLADALVEDGDMQAFMEIDNYSCIEIDIETGTAEPYSLYPKERNRRVLVICSSGIDSTTTAFLYKHLGYEVGLIHFKYGQAAEKVEYECVQRISKKLNAELIVVEAKDIFKAFKEDSLLLKQTKADKKKQMLDSESTLSYVPNRNAIMAMYSAAFAEKNNYDTLSFGGQQMDSVYPDNNPGFVLGVDSLLQYSLNWGTNIRFSAPLIHLIKHEIVELGQKLGIDYDEYTCSCYYPKLIKDKVISCHDCGCCQFRDKALEMVKERKVITNLNQFIDKYISPFT